jgi:single-strand DNA-binding protein
MSVNKVILKGRLGQDPTNTSGVVKFSVATSQKFEDKDGNRQEKTQWHKIVAFGKTGEVLEKYLHKGDEVYIEGQIEYREHEGKYYTSIIVKEFDFISNVQKSNIQNETESDLPY